MSQGSGIGPEPRLAEDGKCINTACEKRDSDQCPVFRLQELFIVPEVNNILDFPKSYRNHAGYKIKEEEMRQIQDSQVIKLEEERFWKEMEEILLLEEAGQKGLTGYQIKAGQR